MKKKCTNSKCRREFSLMEEGVSRCPYCYKMYSRIKRTKKHPVVWIKNDDFDEVKVGAIVRQSTDIPLRDCKKMAREKKLILGEFSSIFVQTAQNHGYNSPMKYVLDLLRQNGNAVVEY